MESNDGCVWDANESGVLLTTMAYQIIELNHSNAGTLRVLVENFDDQPSTEKIAIKENLDLLVEHSPLIDYIVQQSEKYPYLNKILQMASIFSTDYMMLYSTFVLSLQISTKDFEEQMVNEMIELMKTFETSTSDWISKIFEKHYDFLQISESKLKLPKNELDMKIQQTKNEMIEKAVRKLNQEEKDAFKRDVFQFKELSEQIKAKTLIDEIIPKLKFNEKPIIFVKGKTLIYKTNELVSMIYKLQYLDENMVQKLSNIRTESDFLNSSLKQFMKRINFRHRWKDDELWYEWLKQQYRNINFQNVERREQLESYSRVLGQIKTESEVNKINLIQAEINEKKVKEKINEEVLKKERLDKNQLVHCLNIKEMVNEYARNWKIFQVDQSDLSS